MNKLIWVFILFHHAGQQLIPGETLEDCQRSRHAVMAQRLYLEWRVGQCFEMPRKQANSWFAREDSRMYR